MQSTSEGIRLPAGNQQAVTAAILALNDLIPLHPEWGPRFAKPEMVGVCRCCEWPVEYVSGPISCMRVTINTSRILSHAGHRVYARTGVCEKCAKELGAFANEH